MSSKISKVLLGIILFITVVAYALASVIHANTVVNGWIVISGCLALALVSGVTLWRLWPKVTGTGKVWINYIMQVVVACAFFLLLFYIPNSVFSDKSTNHEEKAVAERVYSKTHYRTRRISRRTYGRGEPYYKYYVDLRFENGSRKSLEIPLKQYNRTRKGDTLRIDIEKGLYGFPVIIRKGNYVTVPTSSYRYTHP